MSAGVPAGIGLIPSVERRRMYDINDFENPSKGIVASWVTIIRFFSG